MNSPLHRRGRKDVQGDLHLHGHWAPQLGQGKDQLKGGKPCKVQITSGVWKALPQISPCIKYKPNFSLWLFLQNLLKHGQELLLWTVLWKIPWKVFFFPLSATDVIEMKIILKPGSEGIKMLHLKDLPWPSEIRVAPRQMLSPAVSALSWISVFPGG